MHVKLRQCAAGNRAKDMLTFDLHGKGYPNVNVSGIMAY